MYNGQRTLVTNCLRCGSSMEFGIERDYIGIQDTAGKDLMSTGCVQTSINKKK